MKNTKIFKIVVSIFFIFFNFTMLVAVENPVRVVLSNFEYDEAVLSSDEYTNIKDFVQKKIGEKSNIVVVNLDSSEKIKNVLSLTEGDKIKLKEKYLLDAAVNITIVKMKSTTNILVEVGGLGANLKLIKNFSYSADINEIDAALTDWVSGLSSVLKLSAKSYTKKSEPIKLENEVVDFKSDDSELKVVKNNETENVEKNKQDDLKKYKTGSDFIKKEIAKNKTHQSVFKGLLIVSVINSTLGLGAIIPGIYGWIYGVNGISKYNYEDYTEASNDSEYMGYSNIMFASYVSMIAGGVVLGIGFVLGIVLIPYGIYVFEKKKNLSRLSFFSDSYSSDKFAMGMKIQF